MTRAPLEMNLRDALARAEEVLPESSAKISSTHIAFAYGLVVGSLSLREAEDLFHVIEATVRLKSETKSAYHVVEDALREVGLIKPPKGLPRARPVSRQDKARVLPRFGWLAAEFRSGNPDLSRWCQPIPRESMGAYHQKLGITHFSPVQLTSAWRSLMRQEGRERVMRAVLGIEVE